MEGAKPASLDSSQHSAPAFPACIPGPTLLEPSWSFGWALLKSSSFTPAVVNLSLLHPQKETGPARGASLLTTSRLTHPIRNHSPLSALFASYSWLWWAGISHSPIIFWPFNDATAKQQKPYLELGSFLGRGCGIPARPRSGGQLHPLSAVHGVAGL
jgi:hypothetical protein